MHLCRVKPAAAVFAIALTCVAAPAAAQPVYPNAQWERVADLPKQGWSPGKLKAARDYAATIPTAAVMVVEGGRIVDEWGETATRYNVHSIRKSFLSAMYGIHVADGCIDLTKTLGQLGIDDNAPSLTDVEKQATVHDLLKARSGVYHPALYETPGMKAARPARGSHAPGTFWYYNNWDFNVLGTLFERSTKANLFHEFKASIADPIGMQDFRLEDTAYVTGADSVWPAYPFRMTARDMARFGLLFLRNGTWRDRQVVPTQWVADSVKAYSESGESGGYGYLWWIAARGKHLPGAALPDGSYSARGAGGHYILVIPAYDLVIVHRVNTDLRGNSVSGEQFGRLVQLILDAKSRTEAAPAYSIVLRGGWIADGSGNPAYRADVAIAGDTVAAIAPRIDAGGAQIIDVAGLVVAPGFIDIHTHARRGILDVPTADNYVRQGVTTVIEGPDGGSPVPLKPFLDRVAAARPAVNLGSFIGQGSVRQTVIGEADRTATPDELEKMKALVRQGMEDGALGLSSGLIYVPGNFTPHAEVVELGKIAGAMGGVYISHMRDEATRVADSVRDTIDVGEQGRMPAQITHHKIVGTKNWGQSKTTLALVDAARARGVDATIDQYPYTASSSGLTILLPAWSLDGGQPATVKRLADPATRAKIRAAVVENITYDRGGGDPKNVVIAACAWDPSLAGKSLADIARARGLEVTIENAAETLLALVEKGSAQAVFHAMSEEDLERILKHPATMVASDGEIPIFGKAAPHPRSYGTFARVLGRYVRERKLLTVEEAVRKMSSFPAQRLGLTDRGVLRPGLKADIAVFDAARVRDAATFAKPHQYAEGFALVVVNGEIVYRDGKMTGTHPGRVLRGPSAKRSS